MFSTGNHSLSQIKHTVGEQIYKKRVQREVWDTGYIKIRQTARLPSLKPRQREARLHSAKQHIKFSDERMSFIFIDEKNGNSTALMGLNTIGIISSNNPGVYLSDNMVVVLEWYGGYFFQW